MATTPLAGEELVRHIGKLLGQRDALDQQIKQYSSIQTRRDALEGTIAAAMGAASTGAPWTPPPETASATSAARPVQRAAVAAPAVAPGTIAANQPTLPAV